jgi:hypothetical protein
MKKLIVVILIPLFVLSFVNELSFSQSACNNIEQPKEEIKINQEALKVSQITGWDIEIAEYFTSEAKSKEVLIFEEALPIIAVETGNRYDFNLIHYNDNNTCDYGVFQINDITYDYIIKRFKSEGKEFDSWNKLNPNLNISAGIFWIQYLKNEYNLSGNKLFTSYNKGVVGAKEYAKKYETYESGYSKKVKLEKMKLKEAI